MRHYVLVTAHRGTSATNSAGSGIRKLKRGTSLPEFILDYFSLVGKVIDESCILKRDGTYVVIITEPEEIFSWNFTEYAEPEIISAVSHLTREELLRDLKELLPLKAMQ